MMNKVQLNEIRNVIKNHNYQPNDFELNQKDLARWNDDAIEQLQGSVILKRKSTGKERAYTLGKGTEWFTNFQKDLKQGLFD